MKSFAVAAALVSVVVAHPGFVDGLLGNTGLDAAIKVPAGIEISASLGPKYPPPSGRINTWHPAHPGVDIDGCDATDDDWHYVHPCEKCEHGHHTWTTSTATSVVTKTVIDCAPTVTDCPARTTAVTTVTTTICPATNTATATAETTPAVPIRYSSTTEVPVVTETPCPETTTVALPPQTQTPIWTTAPVRSTTAAPVPPASVVPPVAGNNTWTKPPVIVNGGSQAQIGLFAAVAAVAALL